MQLVGDELWICTLLFTSLHFWGGLSASTPPPSSPIPTLDIYSRSGDSAVLVCRAPEGHRGVQFRLFRVIKELDSRDYPLSAEEAHFTVTISDSSEQRLFCCLFKTVEGRYSTFSPYLQLDPPKDAGPTHSEPCYPYPPILSVKPSNGSVKRGDTLSFHCSLPPPRPQSNADNRPVSFTLLRAVAAETKGMASIIPQPQFSQVSISEPQPGVFSVGPVTGGEQGQYCCIYQIRSRGGLVNSSVSNMVYVTVTDLLPTPTLVQQQQSDVWHLLCKGSPAYPGAVFSLYLGDHVLPVTVQKAKITQHQVVFPVPVQDTAVAVYQCEYSVLLGIEWSISGRSPPLLVSQGGSATPSTDSSGVDWPLVLGSLSAGVLFLCSVALSVVVLHRKVKAVAEAKKKREEARFWTRVHDKDHVVDLTLRRASFTSQDWTSGHTEAASRSQLWNPFSTFTAPISPNY